VGEDGSAVQPKHSHKMRIRNNKHLCSSASVDTSAPGSVSTQRAGGLGVAVGDEFLNPSRKCRAMTSTVAITAPKYIRHITPVQIKCVLHGTEVNTSQASKHPHWWLTHLTEFNLLITAFALQPLPPLISTWHRSY